MADIPGWLRGFQRARASHTTSECLNLSQEMNETSEEISGSRSTSRRHFHQNLGRFTAPSLLDDSQCHLNQVEQIWHNPDPDQMAETLKVAMMTQSSFDPLHVPFNSCILHVLEAYHQMRKELVKKDREIVDLKKGHENNAREFRRQELRWKKREDGYKNEMKRLEVVLATGARGLELVTLSRSMSTLNGSPEAAAIESKQIPGERGHEHMPNNGEPLMSDFAERKDSFTSTKYTSQKRVLDIGRNFVPQQSHRPEGHLTPGQATDKAKYTQCVNNENSDTVRFRQPYSMTRPDNSSVLYLGLDKEVGRRKEPRPRPSREGGSKEIHSEQVQSAKYDGQSHPAIRASIEQESVMGSSYDTEGENRPFRRETLGPKLATHQRGFSFIPGDDFGNLTFGSARPPNAVQNLCNDGNSERRLSSFLSSHDDLTNRIPAQKTGRVRPVPGVEGDRDRVRNKMADYLDIEPEYSGTQSSTSMAGRDQYVGNGNGLERVHNTIGLLKASRFGVSNEATIAAVRAVAGSEKGAFRIT